jgi:molybdopterin-guanine dinucleotide biosynthesis protein A
VLRSAGIVLAGGRSSRMGCSKAALEWHGSTLLRRVAGLLARGVDGPVVVVRAPGQELPPLPASVLVAQDAREGRGPLQGLAAGLGALDGLAEAAFVSSVDAPLLHPAFVRAVLAALDGFDAAVPETGGVPQPLAAAYRISVRETVQRLLDGGKLSVRALLERLRARTLTVSALLADAELAAGDPLLESLLGVNDLGEYWAARARPAPLVTVAAAGRRERVRAASIGAAAAALGMTLDERRAPVLNGQPVATDPQLPLAGGDVLSL